MVADQLRCNRPKLFPGIIGVRYCMFPWGAGASLFVQKPDIKGACQTLTIAKWARAVPHG